MRTAYPLVVLGLLIAFLAQVRHLLLPFILAAALAYLLTPIVRRIKRNGLRHEAAVALVFIFMLAAGASVAAVAFKVFVRSSPEVTEQMPEYLAKVEDVVNEGLRWLRNWEPGQALGAAGWLNGDHEWVLLDFGEIFGHPLNHLVPIAEAVFLIPFLTYYFMLEGPRWWAGLLELAPPGHVEMLLNVLMEVEYAFGGYIKGLLLQAVFMGGVAGLGFWLMGLRYALRIAAWVAMTSMIPFVGPTSAAVAGGAVALFQWGTVAGILRVLAVYLAIRLIDDWFFHPFVMRRAVHLHPTVTVFALLAGAALYGFWGLIFAIPGVCVVKVLLEVTWRYYLVVNGRYLAAVPFDMKVPVV